MVFVSLHLLVLFLTLSLAKQNFSSLSKPTSPPELRTISAHPPPAPPRPPPLCQLEQVISK